MLHIKHDFCNVLVTINCVFGNTFMNTVLEDQGFTGYLFVQ